MIKPFHTSLPDFYNSNGKLKPQVQSDIDKTINILNAQYEGAVLDDTVTIGGKEYTCTSDLFEGDLVLYLQYGKKLDGTAYYAMDVGQVLERIYSKIGNHYYKICNARYFYKFVTEKPEMIDHIGYIRSDELFSIGAVLLKDSPAQKDLRKKKYHKGEMRKLSTVMKWVNSHSNIDPRYRSREQYINQLKPL